jgi:tetratricopeptide (TPR) repeat protein
VSAVSKAVDLGQVLVGEELRQIRRERWSGVLALAQGEVAKGLYLIDGEVVFATSTVEEDRLGANLFRHGLITEAQFRTAMTAAQTPGRRLGQALIEARVLSAADLEAAVRAQVERIILSVFRWSSGRLQRRTMDRPLPADLVLSLCTPRLLLLGAREVLSAARLEQVLGSEERRLRRLTEVAFDYDQLRNSAAERAVLAVASRETTLGRALSLPHPRAQLVRAVYALMAGGLLEVLEAAPASRVVAPAPGLATPADRAVAPPPPAGPFTQPLSAVDPDLLTPSPPPDSEIPGYDEPAADEEPAGWGAGAPGPDEDVPATPEEGERRARALLENGQRERAVAILHSLVERHPDALACRRLLATAMALSGGFDREVERHFLSVLEAEPRDVETRYRLATYYRRAGMSARAVLQLRLVVSADSGHAAAWRDLGELEASAGRR